MKPTPKANILLIDDQPTRLLSYELILSELGQNLVRADSGRQALKLLMADDFAVILLDINMPEMDGFETASLIHQHPRYEKTPIIFVTGVHISDMDRLKGYELGAVDYVFVPVVPQILRAKVSVLVELYNKRRELQTLNSDLEQANARLAELNELLRIEKARELGKLNESLQAANQALLTTNLELQNETLQRQVTQEQLDRSAAILHAINESTQVLILAKDLDGKIIMANPAYMRAVGKDIEAIVGKTEHDYIGHLQSVDEVMRNDRLVIDSRQAAVFEETLELPGGARIYLATKSPFRDAGNTLVGIISVSVEITTQKHVEDTLKQADRRKDEFLALLAHELRNPLAPLMMVVELMGSPLHASRHDEFLAIIRRQIQVLIRLVDDLMEVSRITQGKISLKRKFVDVRKIVRDGIEISRPLIDNGRHRFNVTLPDSPAMMMIDEVRIAQVVANLLNNAAKYTPPEGLIELRLDADTAGINITVRDNGAGISPDFLPEIFKRFAQADGSSSRAQGGLGIGLSLVQDLIHLHGGKVAATSAGAGCGSEFVVRLPATQEIPETIETVPPVFAAPAITSVQRVLVVDDNESACEALKMALELFDAITAVTHSGPEALEIIESFAPTLVLLDLGLPGMDGHELARRIRQMKSISTPRLITISGWGDDRMRQLSREAGIEDHFVKPIELNDLKRIFSKTTSSTNAP